MAYNNKLEAHIDDATQRWSNLVKKKMFGGLCYLIKGNMAFGVYKDFLIVRMERDAAGQYLQERNVLPFDITGKPMAGWIMVKEAGWKSRSDLDTWIGIGKKFAQSLPEKKPTLKPKTKKLREYKPQ